MATLETYLQLMCLETARLDHVQIWMAMILSKDPNFAPWWLEFDPSYDLLAVDLPAFYFVGVDAVVEHIAIVFASSNSVDFEFAAWMLHCFEPVMV